MAFKGKNAKLLLLSRNVDNMSHETFTQSLFDKNPSQLALLKRCASKILHVDFAAVQRRGKRGGAIVGWGIRLELRRADLVVDGGRVGGRGSATGTPMRRAGAGHYARGPEQAHRETKAPRSGEGTRPAARRCPAQPRAASPEYPRLLQPSVSYTHSPVV